eukprot:GGOE01027262.1.p4 GENE.GGOE01027262.1~~GGOE01027262.1.p4  ORF type:complete len:108 (+),score=4.45 GGOE01027262.1:341-664(+)
MMNIFPSLHPTALPLQCSTPHMPPRSSPPLHQKTIHRRSRVRSVSSDHRDRSWCHFAFPDSPAYIFASGSMTPFRAAASPTSYQVSHNPQDPRLHFAFLSLLPASST